MKAVLAVDIGGTKTALALYRADGAADGEEIFFDRFPTEPARGAADLADRIFASARGAAEPFRGELAGSVAAPGPLDAARGVLLSPVKLGWKNAPIAALLRERFGCPFRLANDCDAGALGAWEELGKPRGTFAYVSLSTGVGGGTAVDGRLLLGSGNASDFGHLPVPGEGLACGCGGTDCLELYASGSGIEERYAARTGERADCREIALRARRGERAAAEVFHKAASALDFGLRSIRAALDPAVVAFGGSVSRDLDLLLTRPNGYPFRTARVSDGGKQVLRGACLLAREQ